MIKTRFAPSPTGKIHIGNLKIVLLNYFFSKKYNGVFFLRIEDINKKNFYFNKNIINNLKLLGIYFNDLYFQTKNLFSYNKYYNYFVFEYNTYKCFCNLNKLYLFKLYKLLMNKNYFYNKICYTYVKIYDLNSLRIFINNYNLSFKDNIKGFLFNNVKIDDFFLRKNNNYPSFMFSNFIDDVILRISDILRGEDHIVNTFKQLLILDMININNFMNYYHTSLVYDFKNKKPLSKTNNSISIDKLIKIGYSTLTLINYSYRMLCLLCNKKILTLNTMCKYFNINKIIKSKSYFDCNKLLFWQKKYLFLNNCNNLINLYNCNFLCNYMNYHVFVKIIKLFHIKYYYFIKKISTIYILKKYLYFCIRRLLFDKLSINLLDLLSVINLKNIICKLNKSYKNIRNVKNI